MTGPAFVDTNILVYSRDGGEPIKQALGEELLDFLWGSRLGRVSQQVLQEYYVTVTRKLKPGLSKPDARDDIKALLAWQPLTATSANFSKAWDIEDRFGLSWWDSLIVASALQSQCVILFTEDMQDGLQIDGLRICNPLVPGFEIASL